jgi:transcriptional regulator with XRE-family HTH domain
MNETASHDSPDEDRPGADGALGGFTVTEVQLRPMPAPVGQPPESRVGERLKDARQQLALSVEALSRLTKTYDRHGAKGISPPTLARYESGDTTPNLRELRLLSESLDVPVQWLVDGSLPNMSGQEESQALLAALKAFVRYVQSDINVGGTTVQGMSEWMAQRERYVALDEARKPPSKG